MSSADQPLDTQPTRRRPSSSSLGQLHDDVIALGTDVRDIKKTLAVHSEQLTAHTLQLTSLNAKVNHIDAKVDLVLVRLGPPKGPD